jgi:hypothetical protein
LRKQAALLRKQRSELMAEELDCGTDARDFIRFGAAIAATPIGDAT